MANIKPFAAYRPDINVVSRIAALPYDVFNRVEAKKEVDREPLSFLHIDRAETWFEDCIDTYDDRVYEKAASTLNEWIDNKYFLKEEKPCYYIYQQIMDGRSQAGIVACASVDDYLNNIIKKHENTLEIKELDRIRHIETCKAQTGPIFLAYRQNKALSAIMKENMQQLPLYDFKASDGVIQRVWRIDDEQIIANISKLFESIDNLYIADGHHRTASAMKVAMKMRLENPRAFESNYFMSVLFPDDQLKIMAYNRLVKDINGLSENDFFDLLKINFDIKTVNKQDIYNSMFPSKKGNFGLYINNQWYELISKKTMDNNDVVDSLDVSILQNKILTPILGINNPRNNPHLDFLGGIRGLKGLEERCEFDGWKAAFAMYPTSIEELFAVADENRLMPPKSTWFEPKLRSGLFIHKLDD